MKLSLKTLADRATAMLLFVLFMEISVALALGISCMYDYHFYASDRETYAVQEAFRVKTDADLKKIVEYCSLMQKQNAGGLSAAEQNRLQAYAMQYRAESTNLRFEARIMDSSLTMTNFGTGESREGPFAFSRFDQTMEYDPQGRAIPVSVQMNVLSDLPVSDSYRFVNSLIRVALLIRYPMIALLVLTVIFSMLILGALMSSVEVGSPKPESFIDRIPLDVLIVLLLLLFGFFGVLVALTAVADVKSSNIVLWNAIILIIAFFLIVIAMVFNLSVAARIKRGHVYRNTLIFRTIAKIRKLAGKENDGYFKVPFIGKALLTVGLAVLVELVILLIFIHAYYTNESGMLRDFKFGYYVCFWAVGRFILIPVFFMMALNLNRLRENGEHLAQGDYQFDVDSHIMFGDFRQINANLEKIRMEMIDAAEEKNRSYQRRSELITNISHDIKTPLTSIVNYVDLLKREQTSPQETAEYLDILQAQSGKLKKLLESLIEVSKLTAGDVSVQMETLDVPMFIEQTISEFADRFESKRLQAVPHFEAPEMCIRADGDKLWRVFENLMGNIVKYACEGTRVYIDAAAENGRVRVTFKNTSAEPIRVTGEELTRRFTRGDASRHTDGYGLGLSIAQSLTEIQDGTMDVTVDGDLFRVDLTFASA